MDIYDWRNIALSYARKTQDLTYRFTFISLFNLGIATVLILLILTSLVSMIPIVGYLTEVRTVCEFWVLLVMYLALPFFLERRYRFDERAMQVPFSMALVQLTMVERGENDEESE